MKAKSQLRGADVRAERVRRGISQAQLADAAGYYRQVMPLIERDGLELSQHQYEKLLAVIAQLGAGGQREATARGDV